MCSFAIAQCMCGMCKGECSASATNDVRKCECRCRRVPKREVEQQPRSNSTSAAQSDLRIYIHVIATFEHRDLLFPMPPRLATVQERRSFENSREEQQRRSVYVWTGAACRADDGQEADVFNKFAAHKRRSLASSATAMMTASALELESTPALAVACDGASLCHRVVPSSDAVRIPTDQIGKQLQDCMLLIAQHQRLNLAQAVFSSVSAKLVEVLHAPSRKMQ